MFRIEQKQPNVPTVNLRRERTAAIIKTERKKKREEIFNQRRLTGGVEETEPERPVKGVRAKQLEAWKRSRIEAEKSNKKRKPFVVSTVHHSAGSPYQTRSPFKADAQLKAKSSKKQGSQTTQVLPKPATATGRITRAATKAAKLNETVTIQKKNVFPKLAPTNFKFKAPKGIAPLPMSSHKQTRDLKIFTTFSVNTEKIGKQKETSTPFNITKSSGKKGSAKKASSIKKKPGSPLSTKRKLDYVTPVRNKKSLVVEAVPSDNKIDVSQYRKELCTVIQQLENLCSKWSFTKEEFAGLPNEVSDMVDVATGQTKLLIKEKLAQYRGLIGECEKNCGPVRVTESDLQGFWEMVNLQVQGVISKFEALDVLKHNNWIEPKKQHTLPVKKKKKGVSNISKTKPVAAKSSVRDHITALRRAKAAMQSSESKDPDVTNFACVDTPSKKATQSDIRDNSTPVVVLIRSQLNEKQKRNSRCSTALIKIRNQLQEISTPKTANKENTEAADRGKSNRRVSNTMKCHTQEVLNNDRKAEFEPHVTPPNKTYSRSPRKSGEVSGEDKDFEFLRKTPTFVHSSPSTGKSKQMFSKETPRNSRRSTRSFK